MVQHQNAEVYTQQHVLYSRKNPPPTPEDAHRRLTALQVLLTAIIAEQTTRGRIDFSSGADYETWKFQVARARDYKEDEIKYINAWLAAGGTNAPQRHAEFLRLTADSKQRADAMRLKYQPQYTAEELPADIPTARERFIKIARWRAELDDFVTALNRACTDSKLTSGAVKEVKKPILAVLNPMREEHSLLSKFLHDREGNGTTFLLDLIHRATEKGFELSHDEQARVSALRESQNVRTARKF